MEKKDIKKLLKCYEDEHPKCLTVESYFEEFARTCCTPDKDLDFQIFNICINLHFHSAGKLGLYFAFKAGDMALLNDALYQRACEDHLQIAIHSNYDHSWCCGNLLYTIMAANLFERVPLVVPKALGMAKNGYRPSVVCTNLFMGLYYKDPAFIEQARKEAVAKLGTKMNRFDRANISYLLALLDGKPDEASQHLKDLCEGVKRLDPYTCFKFEKAFCTDAHGLYNFAHYLGIEEIKMPDADNFSAEFAQWQLDNGSRSGKLFLQYHAPMELANTVLSITPPAITLYAPYPDDNTSLKHQRMIDAVKFREQVEADVLRRLGLNPEDWMKIELDTSSSEEELAFFNKHHCNRWSCIKLRKADFSEDELPRRVIEYGGALVAEIFDKESGKPVWALMARANGGYHYTAYFDSLDALEQGL